jgi:hypothetical protein
VRSGKLERSNLAAKSQEGRCRWRRRAHNALHPLVHALLRLHHLFIADHRKVLANLIGPQYFSARGKTVSIDPAHRNERGVDSLVGLLQTFAKGGRVGMLQQERPREERVVAVSRTLSLRPCGSREQSSAGAELQGKQRPHTGDGEPLCAGNDCTRLQVGWDLLGEEGQLVPLSSCSPLHSL